MKREWFVLIGTLGAMAFVGCGDEPLAKIPPDVGGPRTSGSLELLLQCDEQRVEPNQPLHPHVRLVNNGSAPKVIVLPGPSSPFGWREPIVDWEVEYVVNGSAKEACPEIFNPKIVNGACVDDLIWRGDLRVLEAGRSYDITEQYLQLHRYFDYHRPGVVRFRGVYEYTAGQAIAAPYGGECRLVPEELRDCAPYRLVSNWVRVTVAPTLQLSGEVVHGSPIPETAGAALESVSHVTVTNLTGASIELKRSEWLVGVEVEKALPPIPMLAYPVGDREGSVRLGAYASVSVFDSPLFYGTELCPIEPGEGRIRVILARVSGRREILGPTYRTEWMNWK